MASRLTRDTKSVASPPVILLAEDNAADASLVELAIRQSKLDADLRTLADGDAAVDYLRRMGRTREPFCPDLLILDLNLPAASTEEILSVLNRHCSGHRIPVILITGLANPGEMDRICKLGNYRVFTKPNHLEEFLKLGDLVREALAGQQAANPSAR